MPHTTPTASTRSKRSHPESAWLLYTRSPGPSPPACPHHPRQSLSISCCTTCPLSATSASVSSLSINTPARPCRRWASRPSRAWTATLRGRCSRPAQLWRSSRPRTSWCCTSPRRSAPRAAATASRPGPPCTFGTCSAPTARSGTVRLWISSTPSIWSGTYSTSCNVSARPSRPTARSGGRSMDLRKSLIGLMTGRPRPTPAGGTRFLTPVATLGIRVPPMIACTRSTSSPSGCALPRRATRSVRRAGNNTPTGARSSPASIPMSTMSTSYAPGMSDPARRKTTSSWLANDCLPACLDTNWKLAAEKTGMLDAIQLAATGHRHHPHLQQGSAAAKGQIVKVGMPCWPNIRMGCLRVKMGSYEVSRKSMLFAISWIYSGSAARV
mmetsp:Transcript_52130/g.108839  ORF Transcript_52130/g.108839 Transcript_52130/m.108839 type:complete len:383 (-) Transcript_52130:141-1289(-)